MPERFSLLVSEVERLVTAPYAPSLQDLYNIVRQCPPNEIGAWAFCKPCQVGLLGDVLVEGLSRSAISLQLLCNFASTSSFRDALLKRHPAILDGFLQKAVEDGDTEYFPVCTALLSSPFPPDFIAPARLSRFIMCLVDKMGESPSAETIFPLYQLMSGLQTSSSILDTVPSETMDSFQMRLTKILRNLDDHMGNLLCLATFACIASSRRSDTLQSPTWLQNIRHFFGPKRALKTLELIVLRVILACSDSCYNLSPRKAAESIQLAIDICDCVEPEQRNVWIAGNSSKIAKLCEKVARDGISHEARMMGVAFLITILPISALPHRIANLCQQGLLSSNSRWILETIPDKFIPQMVEAVTISLGESAVRQFLSYSFSVMETEGTTNYDSLALFHLAKLFLSGLQRIGSELWTPSITELVTKTGTVTMGKLLYNSSMKPQQSQCDGCETCYAATTAANNVLFTNLFDVYSRIALSERTDEANSDSINPANFLVASMAQMQKSTLGAMDCSFSTKTLEGTRDVLSLRSIRDEWSGNRPTRDWRTGMAEMLMLNARATHESMMKNVEEICYDLEYRCYNTEAPLRAAEEERNHFVAEANKLALENEELRSQSEKCSYALSNCQQDVTRLENQAERASRRCDELLANLNEGRREIESQRQQFDKVILAEKEQAKSTELDLIATVTEREDRMEELQGELLEQRTQNEGTRNTLDDAMREKIAASERISMLEEEAKQLRELLQSSRALATQKDEETKQLLADKERASSVIKDLETKLEEKSLESDKLTSTLQSVQDKSNTDMERLKQEHGLALSLAASESAKQREKIESLQAAMQEAITNSNKELQTKDKLNQHLEKKVQSLRNERAAKAHEFSEAQQHIGRLMNVMGFKPDLTETKSSSKIRRSKTRPEPSPRQDISKYLGESFESIHSNLTGRSPSSKRPRDEVDLSDTTPVPSRPAPNSGSHQSRSCVKQRQERKPLGDIDANDKPASPQSRHIPGSDNAAILDEKQEIDLDDMEVDFEKDTVFTSTAFSDLNDRSLFTQETQG